MKPSPAHPAAMHFVAVPLCGGVHAGQRCLHLRILLWPALASLVLPPEPWAGHDFFLKKPKCKCREKAGLHPDLTVPWDEGTAAVAHMQTWGLRSSPESTGLQRVFMARSQMRRPHRLSRTRYYKCQPLWEGLSIDIGFSCAFLTMTWLKSLKNTNFCGSCTLTRQIGLQC